jgi:serine/threonine protein kinase
MEDVLHTKTRSDSRLSYLHTGSLMDGITHPIIWKTSPSKTEIAIISKYTHGERSLREAFIDVSDSLYSPPTTAELCSLAIQIVKVLEQIHAKMVRHGALRPEVISLWVTDGDYRVCIRDFSESKLLQNRETLPTASIALRTPQPGVIPSLSLCYQAPEISSGNSQPSTQSHVLVNF